MLKARYTRYNLHFKETAVTSRERLDDKVTYFVHLWDDSHPDVVGVGECALFKGLSSDDVPDYEQQLDCLCRNIAATDIASIPYSSIRMGLECAMLDLRHGGQGVLYDTLWTRGCDELIINGLVWMGDKEQMYSRLKSKLDSGFRCVKLKVGGIRWEHELELIDYIRRHHPRSEVEIRLDANGSLEPHNALQRLQQLEPYDIHSIEQPVRQGQHELMAELCRVSPVPVALDEELIGMIDREEQLRMLEKINPAYIVLKPTLCGGLANTAQWIKSADDCGVGWWVTSALESNVGLNAIAQFVSQYNPQMPQGLGTGQLYTNNIISPLTLEGERLRFNPDAKWQPVP